MTATKTAFKGFAATTTAGTPVWVMNEGTLTDGTPAYKVRLGARSGYHGWSGGARRTSTYSGAIGWIAKSKVSR